MRKVYLLIAGALLFTLPASSQVLKFERHPGLDAKLIFSQDFEVEDGLTPEEAYNEWATTPIDTIHELEYYAKLGTGTPRVDIYDEANAADWSVFMVRTDSTSSEYTDVNPGDGIVMFNGADPTSSADEINAGVYDRDVWKIVGDNGTDPDRIAAFSQYGEDGGKYYFQWETAGLDGYVGGESNKDKPNYAGKNWTSQWKSDTRSTAKHRRDLYVRGLDIEDESSYRLTFFIKTSKQNTWGPKFYADVMRGYHHQRAAFSMGYKSGKEFALEMSPDDFNDNEWQKVTLMTYYINDHEADGYVIYNGSYSWDDDWTWRPSDAELAAAGKTLGANDVLNYVKQPDKFFVRLSFCTDSIKYSLDNLSLTKSWIAGCEYYGDMLRIDFGYETNLDDLVKEEKARTNLPALSIPNLQGKYFEVWCKKNGEWQFMPIRSAEYHDDGYMYMFTQYFPVDPEDPFGEQAPLQFGDYDSVFVTFHNPVDMPELTLKYNGSLYPKALDEEWVANGKVVPSFYNELAVPNPTTKIWAGVRSLDGLAPIMTKAPFENGAFGLDASTKTLKFKFTKELLIDDVFNGEITKDTRGVIAYVNNEVWEPSWDAETSSLVITRPVGYGSTLSGDYLIHITQVKGLNGDDGDDVEYNYHFGDFSTHPADAAELYHSDWRATLDDPDETEINLPVGVWVHDYRTDKTPSVEQFAMGEGQMSDADAKSGLYILDYPSDDMDNCGFYLSPRNKSGNGKPKYSGNLYAVVNFSEAGKYSISFKATEWWDDATKVSEGVETHFLLYPIPEGNPEDFTFDTFTNVANKTDLGSIDLVTHVLKSVRGGAGKWPDGVETKEYIFNITTPGDYIIEWKIFNTSNSANGIMIGNYTVGRAGDSDLSTSYVKKLLSAVSAAEAKLEALSDEIYKGADLNALKKAKAEGSVFKGNFPSQYDSVVARINDAVSAMNVRMDTVTLFHNKEAKVAEILASYVGDSLKYKELAVYKALQNHKNANAGWIDSLKLTREIALEIEQYDAEIKALDARMAVIGKFNDKLDEVKAIIDAKDARTDYDEYKVMTRGYNTALGQDLINPADSIIIEAAATLNAAKNVYLFRFDYVIAKTRQIKELFALADTLGYDFAAFGGKKDSIKSLINALEDDEPALSDILRQAVILQINKAYASNDEGKIEKLEGLDVSALIPNYFLYNDAQVGRDMEKSSSGDWRIKRDVPLTTVIPGWTFTSTAGNWYFTTEPVVAKTADYVTAAYVDWEVDGHTFIGGLRSATQTKGVLTNIVKGLPEGYYKVGLYAYNQTSDLAFSFTTKADSIAGNLNTLMNGGSSSNKFNFKEVGIDSVLVVGDLNYTIDQKSNSGSEFDMRSAVLRLMGPNPECTTYAAIVAEQESELAKMVTVVNAPVQGTSVEYYNLGGIKIDAPKVGEILIRKTTSNGKVVVDKVLVK